MSRTMLLGLAAGGQGWVKQVPGNEEEGGAGGGTAAALENMEQILKGNLRAHCSFPRMCFMLLRLGSFVVYSSSGFPWFVPSGICVRRDQGFAHTFNKKMSPFNNMFPHPFLPSATMSLRERSPVWQHGAPLSCIIIC